MAEHNFIHTHPEIDIFAEIITDDDFDVAKDCEQVSLNSAKEPVVGEGQGNSAAAKSVYPAAALASSGLRKASIMTKTQSLSKGKRFTRKMLTKEMQRRYWYLLETGQTDAEEFEVLHEFFSDPVDEDTNDEGSQL
jgi:hypothetical protein